MGPAFLVAHQKAACLRGRSSNHELRDLEAFRLDSDEDGLQAVAGMQRDPAKTEDLHQESPCAANERPETANDGLFEAQASLEEAGRTSCVQFTAEAPKHIAPCDLPVSASHHPDRPGS